MEGENVTGYRIGISYTSTALWYKPDFIATWNSAKLYIEVSPVRSSARAWRIFNSP